MNNKIWLLLLLLPAVLAADPVLDVMPDNFRTSAHLMPINAAEAIIEPFWDPTLSGLAEWQVVPASERGLKVWQNWCWAAYEWQRPPQTGPALEMSRSCDLDCSDYDYLLVSATLPRGARLTITARTDLGLRSASENAGSEGMQEYLLDLENASRLHTLTLKIDSDHTGIQHGWFNWIGLQNSERLPAVLAQYSHFDSQWEGYLVPDSAEIGFTPRYGFLISAQELIALRQAHKRLLAKTGSSPFLEIAEIEGQNEPEKQIGEYVGRDNFRWNRARDHRRLLSTGPGTSYQLALAGLVLEDSRLLRLAARHMLSIAACPSWKEGMTENFPGSIWNHRAFAQSQYAFEAALVLDLAGDCLTWLGREWILRRMAEEAMATIDWVSWKYDYIHHTNQLAWFSQGRIAGALALEKSFPRAGQRVEYAYRELTESLERVILPDGGYEEGPTYFQVVAGRGGMGLYLYARSRGKTLNDVLPPAMRRTTAFAAALLSTDESADVIPICDARPVLDEQMLALMASALPNSAWGKIWQNHVARNDQIPTALLSWLQEEHLRNQTCSVTQPVVHLPDLGLMASTRMIGDQAVKLLIPGNKAGATHTHEDKGSFVLEFAGDTFAMDPGVSDYGNPLHLLLKQAQRHNMLLPTGIDERPAPANPIMSDVKPRGKGDGQAFHAEIDATPGWESYYKHWQRSWESDAPDQLTIRDRYELIKGEGVQFLWNTRLPVTIDGRTAVIRGKRGHLILQAPKDCTLRLQLLPLVGDDMQNQLVIERQGKEGELAIEVQLVVKS